MQFLIDLLIALKNITIALLVSWVRFFIPPPRKCVEGEVVLITGAGRGMGQGIAVEFARLGSEVILWDVNEEGLAETSKMIDDVSGRCVSYVCDVSNHQQVKSVGERVRTEVGEVTMLINNAGIVNGKKFLDTRDEDIERLFGVNLLGLIWTTKQFLPSMMENNHGHIINIASATGLIGVGGLVDYSASKFGAVGFTQTLNYEIHFSGSDGVFTTLVCPNHVNTGMFAGCQLAHSTLVPVLDTKETVEQIMQAILTNKTEVYIPRLVYLTAVLKHMLPVSAMHEIMHFFRVENFMDTFVGHRGSKSGINKEE